MNAEEQLAIIPCPQCGKKTLRMGSRLQAKPLGTFSLAGQQIKVSAVETPVIECESCDFVRFPSK